jgi:hypothetical protein
MNQYKYLFQTCRVPQPECDRLAHSYPPTANHIVVMVRDQIYPLSVRKNGVFQSPSELKSYSSYFL